VRTVVPVAETVEAAHFAPLSASERRTLTDLLQRVLESQDHARAEGRR